MPTRDNEWPRELRLNNSQVTTLFDSLRFDETFSRQWFSTSALTEIIHIQYQLADNHIVLEADQFNESVYRNKSRAAIFTDNLKECSPGMVCRTMIRSYRHGSNESNEYAYCFPTPEKRKRRCTEQDKVIEPRRSSRTNRSHNENINDRTLPGIPCPDVMWHPIILEMLKKRKTSISVLDVIGNVQQVECTTPKRKKKVHASATNIVSPDPMNNNQQAEEKERKIGENSDDSVLSSLNLELVDIWKSRTARNLFGFTSHDKEVDLKSKIDELSIILKGAVLQNEHLMQLMPSGTKVQFEDLNNILDAVPRFSSFRRIFLFDWSSGHAKALDDGLKAGDMGMKYGGVQTKMRKSILCRDSIGNCESRTVNLTEFDESGRPIENTLYSHVYEVGTQTGPVHMFKEEQEHHRNIDQDTKYEWKTDPKITMILRSYSSSIEFPQDDALSSEQLDIKKLRDEKGLK